MRVAWQSILSLLLGFVGGIIGMKVGAHVQSNEWRSVINAGIVRATRFELVDSGYSEHARAYWGQDSPNHRTLIAFLDEEGRPRAGFGTERDQTVDGKTAVYSPFLALVGSDGVNRLQERLDSLQNPTLTMGDSASETRLLLGHWKSSDVAGDDKDLWDKWSLVLRDPSQGGWRDYTDIGATTPTDTKQRTGYLILRSSGGSQLSELPKK